MKKYIISTDTAADMPADWLKEHNVDVHSLYYRFGDEVYGEDHVLDEKTFFDRMRAGEMPTTMGTNPERSKEIFTARVKDGYDVLHLAFTPSLSTSYQSACIAANEVMEENPDSRVIVIDTHSASLGQGLLVYLAVNLWEKGASIDEVAEVVEQRIPNVGHFFTVDNLFHLYRGGRVSRAAAVVGTIAAIKPVLHVDDEGRLIPLVKAHGRKKSLNTLVDYVEQLHDPTIMGEDDMVFVLRDDTTADSDYVVSQLKERLGITKVLTNCVSPTIGAHTGPGIVAIFFFARNRG